MTMARFLVLRLLVLVAVGLSSSALEAGPTRQVSWEFNQQDQWAGWSPNAGIRDVEFTPSAVAFWTVGHDPQVLSPLFELKAASNNQWVEIDLDCDAAGSGELFYTNKTTGQYGGLEPRWQNSVTIPSAGRQVVSVWPFWQGLGKIIRLRFDPPSGTRCRLYGIRIVQADASPPPPVWTFDGPATSWQPMHAARVESGQGQLRVTTLHRQASIITAVEPFDAADRSVLRIDADCPGEDVIALDWVTAQQPGLYGVPIPLAGGTRRPAEPIDLRRFPEWRGTITHLALSFGTTGAETLTLRSISINPNDPDKPFLRAAYFGFVRAINRPGQPAEVRVILEHAGGPPLPPTRATLATDDAATCAEPTMDIPAMDVGDRFVIERTIVPRRAGRAAVKLAINGETFASSLRVDALVKPIARGDYDVPPPRPVKTKYQIGIYYFPGWSPDQVSRWRKQADFPERDAVLGWYEEGRPQVADWHIKWAVENGLSFFVYDWYWRDGKENLTAGLNEGFLKARYQDLMKFALMWANHRPFADHTPEQLLTVTDYWIEHYLRRPNYLTVDGTPYVSFFAPGELVSSLGSEENVRRAFDAMRERVRAAGLPGLHIGACTGASPAYVETLKRCGFDSVTAYNYAGVGAVTAQMPYRSFLLGHEDIWEAMQRADVLPYIPLLTVGWDSRPWHGPRARAEFARRTRDFAEVLTRLKANLDATNGRMAILEAWNEWGEGSYIEPNVEFGFEDLEAIRARFAEPGDWPVNIGPDDVGLRDPYDLRREPAATRAP